MVAKRYPQTAYAGLTKSLQAEWQYVQRVVPDCGDEFAPIEAAIANVFLPALFSAPLAEIEPLRELLALSPKQAGLGLPDPTTTAAAGYAASLGCTEDLTTSLQQRTELDTPAYTAAARRIRREFSDGRKSSEEMTFARLEKAADRETAKRLDRSRKTGAWLSAIPNALNGTVLSQEEFTDNLRVRYGLLPLLLPCNCDGCGAKFTVPHAMACKKGGLVTLRHNDAGAEWKQQCARAFTTSAVSDEPLIHTGRDTGSTKGAKGTQPAPALRGDVGVLGFWKKGHMTIFDVRVTDTDAASYRGQKATTILANHEKEKKKKYNDACLARRRHFTPLVFSVDGMRGAEADAASKRLAALLSEKWKRSYSEVCGYVRSRLSFAIARTLTLCLRGVRDPTARIATATWESGPGLNLYR